MKPLDVQVVLKCELGSWQWWPILQTVDFVPKGKRKFTRFNVLEADKNNAIEALKVANKDLTQLLKEII